jgi:hypothetical protein
LKCLAFVKCAIGRVFVSRLFRFPPRLFFYAAQFAQQTSKVWASVQISCPVLLPRRLLQQFHQLASLLVGAPLGVSGIAMHRGGTVSGELPAKRLATGAANHLAILRGAKALATCNWSRSASELSPPCLGHLHPRMFEISNLVDHNAA